MGEKLFFTCLLFFVSVNSFGQYSTSKQILLSKNVKDSFEIYVSKPTNYNRDKKYDLVYYCDANLKSGKELRKQVENNLELAKQNSTIFVGIGHIGNFHQLRRRDFIPPGIRNGDTLPGGTLYGHCKEFYSFLIRELVPFIELSYSSSGKRTIMGHSLGGLFAIYCFFQDGNIFENYIALSPALWINDYGVFSFDKIGKSLNHKTYLYLSAGSGETMNYILNGTNRMNAFLESKKYSNLNFEYKIHLGKTHNSQVPVSIRSFLDRLNKKADNSD